jgi:hypothetical protein
VLTVPLAAAAGDGGAGELRSAAASHATDAAWCMAHDQSCPPAECPRASHETLDSRAIYLVSTYHVVSAVAEQWLEFSSPVYEQLYQEHFARAYQSTDFYICIVNLFFGLSWVVRVWRINPW